MNFSKKPRKPRLGQHFLTSQGALSDMIRSGNIGKGDIVIEIGPGKGVLTEKLLQEAALHDGRVIAVEKDDSLVPLLQQRFATELQTGKLTLIHDDILNINLETLFAPTQDYKIIANIPYYITGEIIRLFLSRAHKPSSMTLLVQKEVAERMVARDNKESILSLSVKVFGVPQYVSTVKKGSFNPPPKVDSAIIHIGDIGKNLFPLTSKAEEDMFFTLIKAGFHSKRKKVLSNISTIVDPRFSKEKVLHAFKTLDLDENARAEDIHLDKWIALLRELC